MSEIETKRLLLRPFRESDAADVLEYLSSPLPHCFAGLHLDTLDLLPTIPFDDLRFKRQSSKPGNL